MLTGCSSTTCGKQQGLNCGCLVAKSCLTLCDPMECSPARLLCPWDFPGKNTRVGCHALLQGIFPTQGANQSPALAGEFFTAEPPGEPLRTQYFPLKLLKCYVFIHRHSLFNCRELCRYRVFLQIEGVWQPCVAR